MVCLHTAEGARTYQSLGNFFANPANEVSSHVGIDDTPGTVGQYVHREPWEAWTQGNANPVCVSAELCAFASWTRDEWTGQHSVMLDNAAQWVAEEAMFYGIPIRRLTAAEAQGGVPGVCQHIDLGGWGGGHVDCDYGTGNFPMDELILDAQLYAAGGRPLPDYLEDDVFIRSSDNRVRWLIYDGKSSYWRLIPVGCEQNISGRVIDDPNDSWLGLWDH